MSVDDFFQGCSSTRLNNYKFVRWQPPIPGRVKIKFNGSIQNKLAVGEYIIRDWRGEVITLRVAYFMVIHQALWQKTDHLEMEYKQ